MWGKQRIDAMACYSREYRLISARAVRAILQTHAGTGKPISVSIR
jgi:hypothetical protein